VTYAQLTIIAEAAMRGVYGAPLSGPEQQATADSVYNAAIEAGRPFVQPLHPIIEVD
jgi:hypothetical protein